jgi:hypothetical protein
MGSLDEIEMPTTPAIKLVADLLDASITRLLDSLASPPSSGYFEVDDACFSLLALVVRHVESVCTLARKDLVLLPSAFTLARAAYEATMRILWMLDPDDPSAREVRWLAHFREADEYYKRMADQFARQGVDAL